MLSAYCERSDTHWSMRMSAKIVYVKWKCVESKRFYYRYRFQLLATFYRYCHLRNTRNYCEKKKYNKTLISRSHFLGITSYSLLIFKKGIGTFFIFHVFALLSNNFALLIWRRILKIWYFFILVMGIWCSNWARHTLYHLANILRQNNISSLKMSKAQFFLQPRL